MDPDETQSGSNILLPFMIKNSSASAIFPRLDDSGFFSNEMKIPYLTKSHGKINSRFKELTHGKAKISKGNTKLIHSKK